MLYELVKDSSLLTPVVLIGASALVPVPFLDDMAKSYLEKRLFRLLAEKEGLQLTKDEQARLTESPSSGCCLVGCLGSALIYPFKKILRKVFFFLEIKRSVDQATTALAEAYLFRLTLRHDLWLPGGEIESTDPVRESIRTACHSQGVKPLETAIRHGFEGAKGTLSDFASKLADKVTGEDESEEKISRAVDKLEEEETDKLKGLTRSLSDSLDDVSEPYLKKFVTTFENKLKEAQKAAEAAAREAAKSQDSSTP